MTDDELLTMLLAERDRTRELLLASGTPRSWAVSELVQVWRDADARLAYQRWRTSPGGDAYAVYRAAQDRADAAQQALSVKAARTAVLAPARA